MSQGSLILEGPRFASAPHGALLVTDLGLFRAVKVYFRPLLSQYDIVLHPPPIVQRN